MANPRRFRNLSRPNADIVLASAELGAMARRARAETMAELRASASPAALDRAARADRPDWSGYPEDADDIGLIVYQPDQPGADPIIVESKEELARILSEQFGAAGPNDPPDLADGTGGDTEDLRQAAMAELDKMIGLQSVKDSLSEIAAEIRARKAKDFLEVGPGLDANDVSGMHFLFTGNPGTGKTTVARILGQYLHSIGALDSGHVVEVDRTDLVGQYVGHSDAQTKAKIQEALGGILLVDEAYALAKPDDDSKDYGKDVINALNKAMEDHRDNLCVIFTGYKKPMEQFLKANEGLKSRVTHFIDFPDYEVPELMQIFDMRLERENLTVTDGAHEEIERVLTNEKESSQESFGNARLVRKLVDKIVKAQAARLDRDGTLDAVEKLERALLEAQQAEERRREAEEEGKKHEEGLDDGFGGGDPNGPPALPAPDLDAGDSASAPRKDSGMGAMLEQIEALKAAMTTVTAEDVRNAAKVLGELTNAADKAAENDKPPIGFSVTKEHREGWRKWQEAQQKKRANKGPAPGI